MSAEPHIPVMLEQCTQLLALQPGETAVDATLGAGGHSAKMLQALQPGGLLVAFDRDASAISLAEQRLEAIGAQADFILVHSDYREMRKQLNDRNIEQIDAVLFDLGVSSMQLDNADRGFSFRFDAPLDMRMDQQQQLTAEQVVNLWDETQLANAIWQFGEERASRRIAREIVRNRPITSTKQLGEVVSRAVGRYKGEHHPAAKTMQAIRIVVNRELEGLQLIIEDAIRLLKPGGRIVTLTYHSLEARAVKQAFLTFSGKCQCPPSYPICVCGAVKQIEYITKGSLKPSAQEIEQNPRARSAQCRAARKL